MDYAAPVVKPQHPVVFDVAYPERLSRVKIFFKVFLAIPHLIAIYLLLIAVYLLTILAWFSILFTGRYPRAFFEFTSGVLRWQANVITYVALLRDEYPPFSWDAGAYPLVFDVPHAGRQSRFRLFIRWAAVIPSYLVFAFVQVGWFFTTFISWFAILITGRYPRGLFKFAVGAIRWQQRMYAYAFLLRDEYPPYSINADATPGNEVVSTIIGMPLFAAYIALSIFPLVGVFGGDTTVHATLAPATIGRDHPSGGAGSLRITLLDYDGNASPRDAIARAGYRFVSFDVRGEKDGFFPALFWPVFLSVETCSGRTYRIEPSASAIPLRVFWRAGSRETRAYFEIPLPATVCELSYFAGRRRIKFVFR